MDLPTEIAKKLLAIGAIRLSPGKAFTWASGLKSPIYCDNRVSLSHPEVRTLIKKELAGLTEKFGSFDVVAGVATAGIAHGVLVADHLNKPFVYVRSKPKEHGRQNLIEGALSPGARVVVVEDLISTGMSSLHAVASLREAGAEVAGVIAIFTYSFPEAEEAFKTNHCPLSTLTNYPVLLKVALDENQITKEEEKLLNIWNRDPKSWS